MTRVKRTPTVITQSCKKAAGADWKELTEGTARAERSYPACEVSDTSSGLYEVASMSID